MSGEGRSELHKDFSDCDGAGSWACTCSLCGEDFVVSHDGGTRFLSECIDALPEEPMTRTVDPAAADAEAFVTERLLAMGVTDEAAERYLRLCHQRLGHASLRYLRQLHRSGDLLGPDIS